MKNYNIAIQMDSQDARVYKFRGALYIETKQHDKAIQDFNMSIQLNPNDAKTYGNRGLAYFNI